MSDQIFTKKELRVAYLQKRLNLSPGMHETLNNYLIHHCHSIDYSSIEYVHLFLPILQKKEVDLYPLADFLRTFYPHVKIVLSKTDMKSREMSHYLWDKETVFEHHPYGMTEPAGGILVDPGMLDIVFVPLLVFDLSGNRVGYGKGMYDRFLKKCRQDVMKIGLSQFDPVAAIADVDKEDVPLDMVMTDEKIYNFKS